MCQPGRCQRSTRGWTRPRRGDYRRMSRCSSARRGWQARSACAASLTSLECCIATKNLRQHSSQSPPPSQSQSQSPSQRCRIALPWDGNSGGRSTQIEDLAGMRFRMESGKRKPCCGFAGVCSALVDASPTLVLSDSNEYRL